MKQKKGILLYSNNNSGGDWWLTTEDWKNLEKAGWVVHWAVRDSESFMGIKTREYDENKLLSARKFNTNVNYLGAHAVSAAKEFVSVKEGVDEWEQITVQNSRDMGCYGAPHEFTWYTGNKKEYIVAERCYYEYGTMPWD